jgi:twitching motility protein PilU
MEREQAIKLVQQLLTLMKQKNGSDLFISAGFPPAIKVDGAMTPVMEKPLSGEASAIIMRSLMTDRQVKEFISMTTKCAFPHRARHLRILPMS